MNTAIEMVIAVAGLAIAIIELLGEIREKKNEKVKEKRLESDQKLA